MATDGEFDAFGTMTQLYQSGLLHPRMAARERFGAIRWGVRLSADHSNSLSG
jgi:hypothetical protein